MKKTTNQNKNKIISDETVFELSESELKELDNRVNRFRNGETKGLSWETAKQNMLSKRIN